MVAARSMPDRITRRRGAEPHVSRSPESSRWACLLSSISVTVAPLRNLTGDTNQQHLVEAFTDDLVSTLRRHGRGFSLQRVANEPGILVKTKPKVGYLVTGSAQRGSHGMLRVNVRIMDATTSEYLWARRYEFSTEHPVPVQTKIIRRISRELHVLLLQDEIRRASLASDTEPAPHECLSSAAMALEGELRVELSAEAQRWFLAALAGDPRNVEALVGLARTCQELVSNPWWGDPREAAAAADLGREAVAIALALAPGHAFAKCIQGMLYS